MKNQSSQPYFPHVRSGSLEAINSRSNSVLRLKKNSNFKITLAKPKQDADSSAAPSFGDFKRMLKATKGFAPRIRYSHINSNELLELISQPGRALSGVGYRPNQINTFRPFEETSAENFGHYTKRSPGKSRDSSPGSKMSPRNTMYLSKYSSHGGDSIFNISPSPQEKQHKVVKLRKNGFIPDLKYELDRPISFNSRYDKDIIEEPRGRLKPYKVSDKFYLESFVMKDYANRTTQELLGTYRSPQSGTDSLLKDMVDGSTSTRNQSVNNSPQKFLSRRTASISGLRSPSTTKLEVETVQQPIQQITDRRELLEVYKTRQSFNSRKKLVTKAPTVIAIKSEKKVGSASPIPAPTPEHGIIHSPKTMKTMRTLSHIDQSPGLKPQNYNDTRYALKTLRTLRSLGGGLNADADGRSPSPLKNKSTLNGFQVSVIEDSESHFHDHSFNKIHYK